MKNKGTMETKGKKQVYLLFGYLRGLLASSHELLAVCGSHEKAVELAQEHAEYNGEPLTDGDLAELKQEQQTYNRDGNYMITSEYLDELS